MLEPEQNAKLIKQRGIVLKKQIVRISSLQTAKVFALLYFVISIPLVVIMAIAAMVSPAPHEPPVFFLILLPFCYLIFGFIFTIIGAWVYNLIARWVGGIEYTSVESP